jgi:hypothetical protein
VYTFTAREPNDGEVRENRPVTAPATTATTAATRLHWGWAVGGLGAVAAGLIYLYVFDPNEPGHYPLCPTRTVFGVDCPGCGAARCLHALLHGDIARALDHNLLLVVTLPLLIGLVGYWAWGRFVRPERPSRLPRHLAWGFAAVALVFAVARNLPMEPFTYLASGA